MNARWIFMDMNSYFASVEQQERPRLRGRPIIIAPVQSDTTCAIAASYEAKALGIKTGTSVREARFICPSVEVVEARPTLYREYHERIVEILNGLFATVKPLSVDEMACRLSPFQYGDAGELTIARELKKRLRGRLGAEMRASVGLAPNIFLAKTASEMQKPDGLTLLNENNMPGALYGLKLRDLPGIGVNMERRLLAHGINSMEKLYAASPRELRRAWGSVVGERWWFMLRGHQTLDYGAMELDVPKTVGHSHVLPPEFRSERGAEDILLRLGAKALKRVRSHDLAASQLEVTVQYRHEKTFESRRRVIPSGKRQHAADDVTWLHAMRPMLAQALKPIPSWKPFAVGLVFSGLLPTKDVNLSLFDNLPAKQRLSETVDKLNARFGHVVDLAGVYHLYESSPYRIPFGNPSRINVEA